MRKLLLVFSVVAASLGLAACNSITAATLDQTVASLGSSANLQVRLTASASGPGTVQVRKLLEGVSLEVNFSNPSGAALSQSAGAVNSELVVNLSDTKLLDVRVIDANLYLQFDLSSLTSIPGVALTPTQLATAQLVIGGRWFELSKSLLTSQMPSTASTAKASDLEAVARTILNALAKVIDTSPATAIASGGYSEAGTLQSIVDAFAPMLQKLVPSSIAPDTVKGSYRLTLATSNEGATGGALSITAPNGTSGDVTLNLSATVGHASIAVDTPQGATLITPTLINQLKNLGQSGSPFAAG